MPRYKGRRLENQATYTPTYIQEFVKRVLPGRQRVYTYG